MVLKQAEPKKVRTATKRVLMIATFIVALILIPLNWYTIKYSMGVAETFEVNVDKPKYHILIATQSSEFKDSMVATLTQHLRRKPAYIKVIDVSGLPEIDSGSWDALVILHTWENFQPEVNAKNFVDRLDVNDMQKVVVLTTSGSGEAKMEGIDAITSASVISDIKTVSAMIIQRLDTALNDKS